jgi:hypothetical protein
MWYFQRWIAGADPGFQVRGGGGGAHLKKLRRAEGGAKFIGVFRVKNHDFTPKNLIFSNFRGARAGCAPPGSAPGLCILSICILLLSWTLGLLWCHIYRISYVMWYFQCILSVCILLLSLTLGVLWCQHIYRIFSASYPFVSYYVG